MSHVTALKSRKTITRHYEDIVQCKRDLDLHYDGMQACEGDSLEQYLVATTSLLMDPDLAREWATQVKACEDPPGIDKLREFLEQQITAHQTNPLTSKKKTARVPLPLQTSIKSKERHKPAILHFREAALDACPACDEVYLCSTFKGWNMERKLAAARKNNLPGKGTHCKGNVLARKLAEIVLNVITLYSIRRTLLHYWGTTRKLLMCC